MSVLSIDTDNTDQLITIYSSPIIISYKLIIILVFFFCFLKNWQSKLDTFEACFWRLWTHNFKCDMYWITLSLFLSVLISSCSLSALCFSHLYSWNRQDLWQASFVKSCCKTLEHLIHSAMSSNFYISDKLVYLCMHFYILHSYTLRISHTHSYTFTSRSLTFDPSLSSLLLSISSISLSYCI